MPVNDPGPTVFDVQYSTAFGFHTMRLHSTVWSEPSVGHDLGTVDNWAASAAVDVLTMITDLLTLIVPFYPDTAAFNLVTVLTNTSPGAPLAPRASAVLTGLEGTATTPGWTKAVQNTISMRTEGNGIAKLTLLDSASFNSYDAVRVVGAAPAIDAIVAEFTDSANAWSGADNLRPATFIGSFKTLNEALRKAYRMT